ncbi:MAG: hypothetical protein WCV84_00990 [Patescibacteria group bacterium]
MLKSRGRTLLTHKATPPSSKPAPSTAKFWATATIGAFPVAMILSSWYGASILGAFFTGLFASFITILLNALIERRLWMFETRWRLIFEHPEFSFRLALVSGIFLLILETGLLIFFFTSPSLDKALINLVFNRRCQQPQAGYVNLCETLETHYLLDAETE